MYMNAFNLELQVQEMLLYLHNPNYIACVLIPLAIACEPLSSISSLATYLSLSLEVHNFLGLEPELTGVLCPCSLFCPANRVLLHALRTADTFWFKLSSVLHAVLALEELLGGISSGET